MKPETFITDYMRKAFENHELRRVATEPFPIYELKKPGQYSYFVRLSFFPEGIIITGDMRWHLNQAALCGSGYKLDWFLEKLEEDYLCGKFLSRQVWEEDRAEAWLRARLEESLNAGDITFTEKLTKILDDFEDHSSDVNEFIDLLYDNDYNVGDNGVPGYGFPSGDAGWLCLIHEKFRELHQGIA